MGTVYKRLSIRERGHLPNTLRLRPIKEIVVYDDGFEIHRGDRKVFILWSEIQDARVVKRKCVKGYGAAAGMDYLRKTFLFIAKGRRYGFDISSSFPDFDNSIELENTLYSKLSVSEVNERSSNDRLYNIIVISVLILLAYLLKDM